MENDAMETPETGPAKDGSIAHCYTGKLADALRDIEVCRQVLRFVETMDREDMDAAKGKARAALDRIGRG